MPGVMIKGAEVAVPGLKCRHFKEEASFALKEGEDCRPRRTSWIRGITLHTTKGEPDVKVVKPGLGPNTRAAQRINKWWGKDGRRAGCHLMADLDASWACLADLTLTTTFHAGAVNDNTIGIEIYQDEGGVLYEGQLESVVKMVDFLTRTLGIQRQVHYPYAGPITRFRNGGDDCIGIHSHRDVTSTRGRGDPGDAIFEKLILAGYEPWDYDAEEDLSAWKIRQTQLNDEHAAGLKVDGVAGPGTTKALKKIGKPHGMWVTRPGD